MVVQKMNGLGPDALDLRRLAISLRYGAHHRPPGYFAKAVEHAAAAAARGERFVSDARIDLGAEAEVVLSLEPEGLHVRSEQLGVRDDRFFPAHEFPGGGFDAIVETLMEDGVLCEVSEDHVEHRFEIGTPGPAA